MTDCDFAHFKSTPEGARYAGDHLLVEMWEAEHLENANRTLESLEKAAIAAGATVLHSHIHSFGQGMGVSGVVVLAESHITIHTWPEYNYAAIDIFMCGECDPMRALPTLEKYFATTSITYKNIRRGDSPYPPLVAMRDENTDYRPKGVPQ